MAATVRRLVDIGIPSWVTSALHPIGPRLAAIASRGVTTPRRDGSKRRYRAPGRGCVRRRAGARARPLASQITKSLSIPTIGIGAGPACDGQVLVLHDMLGLNDQFSAKFVKKYRRCRGRAGGSRVFAAEVREGAIRTGAFFREVILNWVHLLGETDAMGKSDDEKLAKLIKKNMAKAPSQAESTQALRPTLPRQYGR